MSLDFGSLFLSFVFGLIGMGMFMFGKRAGRAVPLFAGLGLMIIPYFIANTYANVAVCATLVASPFIVRD